MAKGRPDIFNTDQGARFTGPEFTERLQDAGAWIGMDGRDRAFDNIFVERLWRSVKYEEVYTRDYEDVFACIAGVRAWSLFYNDRRPYRAPGCKTPRQAYSEQLECYGGQPPPAYSPPGPPEFIALIDSRGARKKEAKA